MNRFTKSFKILLFLNLLFLVQLAQATLPTDTTFLIFGGKTGWIGQQLVTLLEKEGYQVYAAESRLENREELEKEILKLQPTYIFNAAGMTGRPNIDWCEDNKHATIRANLLGALNLVDVAFLHNIPVTNFGTGCIYHYDDNHPMGSGVGFKEEDEPNFAKSFYSHTKIILEKMIMNYPNVLNLRLRMPISSDLHPRSFVTKIINYEKVINVPNSMSILDDLLPIAIEMTIRGLKGVYNFTNPGAISHNQVLALYKEFIDPNYTWTNFSVEEQSVILKAARSNTELDVSKLLAEFPNIPHIKQSIRNVFERMQTNLKNN